MANAMSDDDLYDQDPREASNESSSKEKDDEGYETFLAPKSAFKGDISVGTVHRVRIERALDEELELKCLGVGKDEPEKTDNTREEESEFYK
jgi:hypothetical protein